MADSSITKRALAAALKELLEADSFSKISIGEICYKCAMNRKSFYYHFHDKYELVNFIFDSEFAHEYDFECAEADEIINELIIYLYDNRAFYRKVIIVEDQNSFSNHLKKFTVSLLSDIENFNSEYELSFKADLFVFSVKRWLSEKDTVLPEEFIKVLDNQLF